MFALYSKQGDVGCPLFTLYLFENFSERKEKKKKGGRKKGGEEEGVGIEERKQEGAKFNNQ